MNIKATLHFSSALLERKFHNRLQNLIIEILIITFRLYENGNDFDVSKLYPTGSKSFLLKCSFI